MGGGRNGLLIPPQGEEEGDGVGAGVVLLLYVPGVATGGMSGGTVPGPGAHVAGGVVAGGRRGCGATGAGGG